MAKSDRNARRCSIRALAALQLGATLAWAPACGSFSNVEVNDAGQGGLQSAYVLGSHFVPSDRLILTEFHNFGGPDVRDYPLCIYPEADGQQVNDPEAVREHMETVVNTWLPYLYGQWGFGVRSVSFARKASTQADCEDEYGGFRPFSVTSYEGGAFGGMAIRIRVRFPGATLNRFANGTAHRQSILHEVGHVFGLMHTMGESPESVMDYDDMHTFEGISGDDIVGMVHAWRYLSEQISRGDCEFGYAGGPSCATDEANLDPIQIRNESTSQCIEVSDASDTAGLTAARCNGTEAQKFAATRGANGWQLRSLSTNRCVASANGSQAMELASCDPTALAQDFTLVTSSDDGFLLRNEHSGKVLQMQAGDVAQSPPHGEAYQVWRLEPPIPPCQPATCGDPTGGNNGGEGENPHSQSTAGGGSSISCAAGPMAPDCSCALLSAAALALAWLRFNCRSRR